MRWTFSPKGTTATGLAVWQVTEKCLINDLAFFDCNESLEYAKATGKPLFVDFTGHGYVNCREMESRVWSDPRVLKMLTADYVQLLSDGLK